MITLNDKKNIIFQNMDVHKINKILLKCELKTCNIESNITFNNNFDEINCILNKFHVMKNNIFEDEQWIMHLKNSKKYKINNENVFVYENSILIHNKYSIIKFIDDIINYLSKTFLNVKFKKKIIDDKTNKISWILIVCKRNNKN
jgi:hypothetical protein